MRGILYYFPPPILRFSVFCYVFGPQAGGNGAWRCLESFPEAAAPSSPSMSPWGATGTPFMIGVRGSPFHGIFRPWARWDRGLADFRRCSRDGACAFCVFLFRFPCFSSVFVDVFKIVYQTFPTLPCHVASQMTMPLCFQAQAELYGIFTCNLIDYFRESLEFNGWR